MIATLIAFALVVLIVVGVYYTYTPPHDLVQVRFTVLGANRGFRLEIAKEKWMQIQQPNEWEDLSRHTTSLSEKTNVHLRDLVNEELSEAHYCLNKDWSILDASIDGDYARLIGTCDQKED